MSGSDADTPLGKTMGGAGRRQGFMRGRTATRMLARGDARRKVHSAAFVLISAAIFVAGCANQQQPDAQAKEDKAALQEAAKEIGSIDDARCQSFGFRPSSPDYIKCRKELDSERSHMGIKE